MSGESGAASEGLLTIRVWAFVGPFPRVYTSMSRQRARVTEWLWAMLDLGHTRWLHYIPLYSAHTCEVFHQCVHERVQLRRIFV